MLPGILSRVGLRPHICTAERRARLATRQLLTPNARVASPLDVARAMVALHATDAATVFLSAAARMNEPSIDAIEKALYEDRSVVRMLGMRRTMYVVPRELTAVVQAACTRAIAAKQRKLAHQLFEAAGLAPDVPTWLVDLEMQTYSALAERGEATAQELGQDVPELKTQIRVAADKNYAAMQGIGTRVLTLLSADGRVVRGRPRGSWISSQYRWSTIERWLPNGLPEWQTSAAQAELVRAWLRSFGPGTLSDVKWWTGLTMGEIKRAVSALDTREVDLDTGTGLVLADDAAPIGDVEPWVALLPALDPTPMGYADRTWFLGAHGAALFDRSGNIGPTVWLDGRIVGGWAHRPDGVVAFKLLEDVGAESTAAVERAAHTLGRWIGTVRITPRFRTRLERELSA